MSNRAGDSPEKLNPSLINTLERDDFKSTHPATEAVEAEAKQTGGLRPARDIQNG